MITNSTSNRLLTVASLCLLALGAITVNAEARGQSVYFRASAEKVRAGCGGTYLGTNKDGFYGCISRDGKAVTTCKNGKCVTDPARIAASGGNGGRGDHQTAGNESGKGGGSSGGGSGGGTGGKPSSNASTNNAGMSTGSGGGGVIN